MQDRKISARASDGFFRAICRDILDMEIAKVRRDGSALSESPVDEIVARISGRSRRPKIVAQEGPHV